MNQEVFKDVAGYEGLYQVSNYGRVMSLVNRKGEVMKEPRELKPSVNGAGYCDVRLCKGGIQKTHSVHRLIALAFVPNDDPEVKTTVDHIDEDKTNNRADNLQWLSLTDNIHRSVGNRCSEGVIKSSESIRRAKRKYSTKRNAKLYTNGVEVVKFSTLNKRIRSGKTSRSEWKPVEDSVINYMPASSAYVETRNNQLMEEIANEL